jgi:hypothetical protein
MILTASLVTASHLQNLTHTTLHTHGEHSVLLTNTPEYDADHQLRLMHLLSVFLPRFGA